jgi:hypothetical protein
MEYWNIGTMEQWEERRPQKEDLPNIPVFHHSNFWLVDQFGNPFPSDLIQKILGISVP